MTIYDFVSLHWWLVGLPALLVWAVLSDLVKKGIYAAFGKMSSRVRRHAERLRNADLRRGAKAAANPAYYAYLARAEQRHRSVAVYHMVWAATIVAVFAFGHTVAAETAPPNTSPYAAQAYLTFGVAYVALLVLTVKAQLNWGRAHRVFRALAEADKVLVSKTTIPPIS